MKTFNHIADEESRRIAKDAHDFSIMMKLLLAGLMVLTGGFLAGMIYGPKLIEIVSQLTK